jgi:hypothetical protein
MASRLDLMAGRSVLERSFVELGIAPAELELCVYDLLASSRIEYLEGQETILEREIDLLLGSSAENFGSDQRMETKSRLLSWLQRFGHSPAYIVALNFDPDSEHEQHRFRGGDDSIFSNRHLSSEELKQPLRELGYRDGAILIRPDGKIYAVRAQLTNIDPKAIHAGRDDLDLDDPRVYGFKGSVNVRHFSALGASFHLPGLVTYTLSEETGDIRRYEKGKITFSTLQDEEAYQHTIS